jgi:hypothetical protein
MLDISFRSNKPGSIVVYADGEDARLLQKLISHLGSEEKAQNAIILSGFLSKLERKGGPASEARASRVRQKFEEMVGIPFEEFRRLIETI